MNRPGHDRRVATALLVALAACGTPSPTDTVTDPVSLTVMVPVPAFEGLDPSTVRFVVESSGGALLVDTTLAVPGSAARTANQPAGVGAWDARDGLGNQATSDVQFTVSLPGSAAGMSVVLSVTILDGTGAVIYEGVEQAIADLGSATAVTITDVFYAGAGASATEMSLQVEGTFFQAGDVHLVSATIRDAQGSVLTDVPTLWTINVPSFSVVRTYYTGGQSMADVMANSTSQSAMVTALLPNGVQASASLHVELYYPRAILLDVPDLQAEMLSLRFEADAFLELDTIIAIPTAPEMSIYAFWDRLQTPVVRPMVRNDAGTLMYQGVQSYLVDGGARVPMDLEYVGPGASAADVQILPGSPIAVTPGVTLNLEAEARDSGGFSLPFVPIQWSGNGAAEVVSVTYSTGATTEAEIRVPDAEGVYEIVATAPNGVADTLSVTVAPLAGRGVTITFDQGDFPDGSTWVDGVVVAEQYASLGAHFDFLPSRVYNDLQGGPTLAVDFGTTSGSLSVDFLGTPGNRQGRALGHIVTNLDTPVPEVRMTFWSPTGDVDFEVRDGDGQVIENALIVKTGTETPWEHREVIITVPAGIYSVWAYEEGATYYLDNIRY